MRLIEKFAFDTTTRPPVYGVQTFDAHGDTLEHRIEGELRAMVDRSQVLEYIKAPSVAQALAPADVQTLHEWSAGS